MVRPSGAEKEEDVAHQQEQGQDQEINCRSSCLKQQWLRGRRINVVAFSGKWSVVAAALGLALRPAKCHAPMDCCIWPAPQVSGTL